MGFLGSSLRPVMTLLFHFFYICRILSDNFSVNSSRLGIYSRRVEDDLMLLIIVFLRVSYVDTVSAYVMSNSE